MKKKNTERRKHRVNEGKRGKKGGRREGRENGVEGVREKEGGREEILSSNTVNIRLLSLSSVEHQWITNSEIL